MSREEWRAHGARLDLDLDACNRKAIRHSNGAVPVAVVVKPNNSDQHVLGVLLVAMHVHVAKCPKWHKSPNVVVETKRCVRRFTLQNLLTL